MIATYSGFYLLKEAKFCVLRNLKIYKDVCTLNVCTYICTVIRIEEAIKSKFKSEEQKLLINLLYTANWLKVWQNRFFKPFGITSSQYNVMRIINGQQDKPASVQLIQERMIEQSSNASRLIDKLEIKQLVERKSCPSDRRQVDILLTPEGKKLLLAIEQQLDLETTLLEGVDKKQIEIANNVMDLIRNNP